MLKSIGISIIITWCPGHCDILYNDMADEEAKRSAEMLSLISEYVDPVKKLDLSSVKMIIKEEQTRAWQLSWERSVSGGSTRDLIPSVRKNITWSGIRTVDMSYTRHVHKSSRDFCHCKFCEKLKMWDKILIFLPNDLKLWECIQIDDISHK